MGIPVVAIVDSNTDPTNINWSELKTYAKWTIGWVQLTDQD